MPDCWWGWKVPSRPCLEQQREVKQHLCSREKIKRVDLVTHEIIQKRCGVSQALPGSRRTNKQPPCLG